jgi:MFS family permease
MTPLRDASFRRLWLAGLISDTGDWLLLVSLPIVVYQYTGSALGTAATFLVELVPPVVLAPIAGALADRADRRRTLIAVAVAQAALLTPLLLVEGRSGLWIIYVVAAAQSALGAVFDPTKNALLPTLVPRSQLVSANSLVGLGENIGRLAGGSLGGVVLAVGGGLSTIVAVDAASFLLAAALIALLPTRAANDPPARAAHPGPPERSGSALEIGPLRPALAVMTVASVAQGILVVLFVVFVARSLHGTSAEIGLLRGVQAIGAIACGVVLAARGRITAGRLTAVAAVTFGILDLAIWNAPHLTTVEPVYIALFIAPGAPGIGIMTGLTSATAQATTDGQRGRAFAAMDVAGSVARRSA